MRGEEGSKKVEACCLATTLPLGCIETGSLDWHKPVIRVVDNLESLR